MVGPERHPMDELRLSVLIVVMALCTAATFAQTSRVYELDMEGKRVGYSRFTRAKAAQGVATSCETVRPQVSSVRFSAAMSAASTSG